MTLNIRVVALMALTGVLVVAFAALQARDEVRSAWRRSLIGQAEETGAFARRALAAHSDLLVAERLAELARRSEVQYVLILDRAGKASFHGRPEDVGKVYESSYAKAALAATATLVQDIPEAGATEADVPLGTSGVLRLGFTLSPLAPAERWIWMTAGLAAVLIAGAWLLAARAG